MSGTGKTHAKKTIESLQAGRGIAAVAVVLYHASMAGRDFGGMQKAYDILSYGRFGVDFFFVLSGFIIYHSTVGRRKGLRQYAMARFRRVYLPYFPIGIAMALLYASFHKHSGQWSWISSLTLAPINLLPALVVAWTLQHEIMFYVLFGLFYFSGTLVIGLAAWIMCIVLVGHHVPFADVNLEFLFGIAAAILYRRGHVPRFLIVVAPILLVIWILLGGDDAHRVWVGAAAACVIATLADSERHGRSVPRPLLFLGAASYSLYLVHCPIISAVARLVPGVWITASAIAASMIGGFAYHFAVEKRTVARKANPEVFLDPLPRPVTKAQPS